MGSRSRTKGASGEREFCKTLGTLIGIDCLERNLEQTRSGGHDLNVNVQSRTLSHREQTIINQLNLLAIEIKRHAKATPATIQQWWTQTTRQAGQIHRNPLLAFREDRGRWQVIVPFSLNRPTSDIIGTIRMDIELFAEHLISGSNPDNPSSHKINGNDHAIRRKLPLSGFQPQL